MTYLEMIYIISYCSTLPNMKVYVVIRNIKSVYDNVPGPELGIISLL